MCVFLCVRVCLRVCVRYICCDSTAFMVVFMKILHVYLLFHDKFSVIVSQVLFVYVHIQYYFLFVKLGLN